MDRIEYVSGNIYLMFFKLLFNFFFVDKVLRRDKYMDWWVIGDKLKILRIKELCEFVGLRLVI